MTRQLRAELAKVAWLRLTWLLALLAAGYVAANALLMALLAGSPDLLGADTGIPPDYAATAAYGAGLNAFPFALVVGILMITGEFRHGTASTTFLVTPRRGVVVGAKFVTALLVGVVYATVGAVAALGATLPTLALTDATDVLPASEAAPVVLGAWLAASLYGVMGVAIGALVRNQIAAVVGSLVYFLLLEDLVVSLLPQVGQWLPGGAATAVARIGTITGEDLLPPAAGAVLFLAYAAALAAVAVSTTVRRDV